MFKVESKTELSVAKLQNYITLREEGNRTEKHKLGGGGGTAQFLDGGNKWGEGKDIMGGGTGQCIYFVEGGIVGAGIPDNIERPDTFQITSTHTPNTHQTFARFQLFSQSNIQVVGWLGGPPTEWSGGSV